MASVAQRTQVQPNPHLGSEATHVSDDALPPSSLPILPPRMTEQEFMGRLMRINERLNRPRENPVDLAFPISDSPVHHDVKYVNGNYRLQPGAPKLQVLKRLTSYHQRTAEIEAKRTKCEKGKIFGKIVGKMLLRILLSPLQPIILGVGKLIDIHRKHRENLAKKSETFESKLESFEDKLENLEEEINEVRSNEPIHSSELEAGEDHWVAGFETFESGMTLAANGARMISNNLISIAALSFNAVSMVGSLLPETYALIENADTIEEAKQKMEICQNLIDLIEIFEQMRMRLENDNSSNAVQLKDFLDEMIKNLKELQNGQLLVKAQAQSGLKLDSSAVKGITEVSLIGAEISFGGSLAMATIEVLQQKSQVALTLVQGSIFPFLALGNSLSIPFHLYKSYESGKAAWDSYSAKKRFADKLEETRQKLRQDPEQHVNQLRLEYAENASSSRAESEAMECIVFSVASISLTLSTAWALAAALGCLKIGAAVTVASSLAHPLVVVLPVVYFCLITCVVGVTAYKYFENKQAEKLSEYAAGQGRSAKHFGKEAVDVRQSKKFQSRLDIERERMREELALQALEFKLNVSRRKKENISAIKDECEKFITLEENILEIFEEKPGQKKCKNTSTGSYSCPKSKDADIALRVTLCNEFSTEMAIHLLTQAKKEEVEPSVFLKNLKSLFVIDSELEQFLLGKWSSINKTKLKQALASRLHKEDEEAAQVLIRCQKELLDEDHLPLLAKLLSEEAINDLYYRREDKDVCWEEIMENLAMARTQLTFASKAMKVDPVLYAIELFSELHSGNRRSVELAEEHIRDLVGKKDKKDADEFINQLKKAQTSSQRDAGIRTMIQLASGVNGLILLPDSPN